MTRDAYLEMCADLNEEPKEENIPVEFDDFTLEVQQAFGIYNLLRDEWDGFNGVYLGKSLIGITEIFEISGVESENRYIMILLVKIIDKIRAQQVNKKEKPAK